MPLASATLHSPVGKSADTAYYATEANGVPVFPGQGNVSMVANLAGEAVLSPIQINMDSVLEDHYLQLQTDTAIAFTTIPGGFPGGPPGPLPGGGSGPVEGNVLLPGQSITIKYGPGDELWIAVLA